MSVNQKILIKSLGIGIVGLFAIFLLSSICHIAIFGPLWVEYTWFTGKKLGFSYKTELKDTTGVQTIVWSTDGRYLLLGSFDNSRFKVYDTRDWTLVNKFRTAEGGLVERSQAQFIPFSHTILLPTISSLPPPDTTSLQEWDVEKNVIEKSFSVKFIDPAFAEERGASHPGGVAVSGDGKFVADSVGGDYGDIFVFDHKTSQIVQRIHCDRYSGIGALALNENGGTVVVGDCHRDKVSFFDVKTGDLEHETDIDDRSRLFNFMFYSPDGTKVVVGSTGVESGDVRVLRARDGVLLDQFPPESLDIANLQWIDNDRILVSYPATSLFFGGSAQVLDLASGRCIEKFGPDALSIASLDDQGNRIAVATDWGVFVMTVNQ